MTGQRGRGRPQAGRQTKAAANPRARLAASPPTVQTSGTFRAHAAAISRAPTPVIQPPVLTAPAATSSATGPPGYGSDMPPPATSPPPLLANQANSPTLDPRYVQEAIDYYRSRHENPPPPVDLAFPAHIPDGLGAMAGINISPNLPAPPQVLPSGNGGGSGQFPYWDSGSILPSHRSPPSGGMHSATANVLDSPFYIGNQQQGEPQYQPSEDMSTNLAGHANAQQFVDPLSALKPNVHPNSDNVDIPGHMDQDFAASASNASVPKRGLRTTASGEAADRVNQPATKKSKKQAPAAGRQNGGKTQSKAELAIEELFQLLMGVAKHIPEDWSQASVREAYLRALEVGCHVSRARVERGQLAVNAIPGLIALFEKHGGALSSRTAQGIMSHEIALDYAQFIHSCIFRPISLTALNGKFETYIPKTASLRALLQECEPSEDDDDDDEPIIVEDLEAEADTVRATAKGKTK
ncbi:hypothetical protein ACG7TL_003388 [Trametes sanguinea]